MSGRHAPLASWLREGAAVRDARALEDGERAWTHDELWRDAERVAAALEQECGPAGGPLAIVATNSAEYVLTLLAGLISGRPLAEISPQESPERIARLLARLEPAAVVTSLPRELFTGAGAPVLDPEWVAARAAEEENRWEPAPQGRPGDLAFVVFTSGTTGDPKGVMLGAENVRAVTEAILGYLPVDADERYGLLLPLFHTYGKSVLLTTLRAGGTVVLEGGFENLPAFVRRLAEQRITALSGVPYHINMLLRRGPLDRHDLSRLRLVTISGSHLPHAALQDLRRRLPGAQVFFMYGLTESSTRACYLPPAMIDAKPGSCGRPLEGVTLRIVDEQGHERKPGEIGEVLVRGPNVMRGYWGEPELTAAVLKDGWLHTGDLGHVDEDGYLFLVGRRRDLIKCAGERISAHEIEEVLAEHPGLLEAVVAGVPHPILGEMAQAWVVRRDEAVTDADLRRWCSQRLTHHRIPRAFVFVEELPKTPSGKVQKHRLPRPGAAAG